MWNVGAKSMGASYDPSCRVFQGKQKCPGNAEFLFCLLISQRLESLWHTTSQFYTNLTVEVRHVTRLLTAQSAFSISGVK